MTNRTSSCCYGGSLSAKLKSNTPLICELKSAKVWSVSPPICWRWCCSSPDVGRGIVFWFNNACWRTDDGGYSAGYLRPSCGGRRAARCAAGLIIGCVKMRLATFYLAHAAVTGLLKENIFDREKADSTFCFPDCCWQTSPNLYANSIRPEA